MSETSRARHEIALKDLRVAGARPRPGRSRPSSSRCAASARRTSSSPRSIFVAAYLLITQLAEIGFDTIADELREADVPWVVSRLVLAQLTFVAQAISLQGAVATPLPLLPCVVLQSAIKFINLTVPSSAGRICDQRALPAANGGAHR